MKTQRVCVFFLSAVTEELLAHFKKAGVVVNSGVLSYSPLINHLEFNAFIFEPEGLKLLKEFSKKEKIIFFWAYNEDLDMDIDSAGAHKDYVHSWGVRLFGDGEVLSSLIIKDNWPTYGEALKASINEALDTFNTEAFKDCLKIDESDIAKLRGLFNKEYLFQRFENTELDQLSLRDAFLEIIKVDV